jgi:hypothetical protein
MGRCGDSNGPRDLRKTADEPQLLPLYAFEMRRIDHTWRSGCEGKGIILLGAATLGMCCACTALTALAGLMQVVELPRVNVRWPGGAQPAAAATYPPVDSVAMPPAQPLPVAPAPVAAQPQQPAPMPSGGNTYSGRGDSVINIVKPNGPALLIMRYGGSGYLILNSLTQDNQLVDLLATSDGPYQGTVLLDGYHDSRTARIQVRGSGEWSFQIAPLSAAQRLPVPGNLSGAGDTVIAPSAPIDTMRFQYSGRDYLIVTAVAQSSPNLLATNAGAYDGTVVVPADTVVIVIRGRGSWTATTTSR